MCGLVLNALILVGLLKAMDGEEVDMLTAVLLGFGTSVVSSLIVLGLAAALGAPGAYLGIVVSTALLGVALSALFGTEIKRAMLISVCYLVVQIVMSVAMSMMFRA